MLTKLIELEKIDSTNTYALMQFEKLFDKTAITALEQTNGKGRFNRVWLSENCENLYLSLILKPQKKDNIVNLTQYMSVVISKVLESYGIKPEIKYPNDVLVNGKKICGILCESSLKKNIIQGVVLGAGINLNSPQSSLDSLNKPATSLNIELNKKIDRNYFLNNLLEEFFYGYEDVIEKGFDYFKEDYLKRINFLGKIIGIKQREGCETEKYTALRFDEKGNLVVLTFENKEKIIFSGDLIY